VKSQLNGQPGLRIIKVETPDLGRPVKTIYQSITVDIERIRSLGQAAIMCEVNFQSLE
jgi:hypothetical protein